MTKTLTQTGPNQPPAPVDSFQTLREHTYTVVFRVCGRRGLVPRGC